MKIAVDRVSPFFWGVTLFAWMSVIFLLSSLPGSENIFEPTLFYLLERKGAHIIEYAVLMFVATRFTLALFPDLIFKRAVFFSAVFSLLYAASDEWHQSFVPYRGAKVSDVAIDGLGILLTASILLVAWYQHQQKKI